MTDTKVNAVAHVRLVVEVDCGQPWGGDCSLQQVYDQAADNARKALINGLVNLKGIRAIGDTPVIRVVIQKCP